MTYRRSVLSGVGLLSAASVSGCLDSLPGGIAGGGDVGGNAGQPRQIVTTYDEALTARNDAVATRDEGITAFNERNYSEAIEPLETARSGYEDAEDGFADAAKLTDEIDETGAADICETSLDATALEADATDAALSRPRGPPGTTPTPKRSTGISRRSGRSARTRRRSPSRTRTRSRTSSGSSESGRTPK